jgi:hypothetical protein
VEVHGGPIRGFTQKLHPRLTFLSGYYISYLQYYDYTVNVYSGCVTITKPHRNDNDTDLAARDRNPNSIETMTVSIADAARRAAGEGTEIIANSNMEGPPSIQGEADGVAAVGGVLALISSASNNVDAVIIACFDDT